VGFVEVHVLFDGEDQTSDCAALSVGFVTGKTNQNDCKELIDSVEIYSHDSANVRKDLLGK
jgi:hypothetical protein